MNSICSIVQFMVQSRFYSISLIYIFLPHTCVFPGISNRPIIESVDSISRDGPDITYNVYVMHYKTSNISEQVAIVFAQDLILVSSLQKLPSIPEFDCNIMLYYMQLLVK